MGLLDLILSESGTGITLLRIFTLVRQSTHKTPTALMILLNHISAFVFQVTGVTDLVITASSYSTLYSAEVFFCVAVVGTFLFSLLILVTDLLHLISKERLAAKYVVSEVIVLHCYSLLSQIKKKWINVVSQLQDMCFHIVGSAFLLIGGMFMLAAAIDRPHAIQSLNTVRVLAAVS
jgi:uncharacterized PurR-regulated membrane protein YhhQ (DUF165 family)